MKFTIDEYRMLLHAVNLDMHQNAKASDTCKKQGNYLTSGYYADRSQAYRKLYDKMVDMIDDITE